MAHGAVVRSVCLATLAVIAGCTPAVGDDAQTKAARRLVEEVEQTLKDLSAYSCDMSVVMLMKAQGMENRIASDYEVRIAKPRRWAIEMTSGMMGGSSYSDGKQQTAYLSMTDSYVVEDLPDDWEEKAAEPANFSEMMMLGPAGFAGLLMGHGLAETMMEGVGSAKIGDVEAIDGTECQRIDFTQEGLDWQLWVEQGERKLPRKLLFKPDLSAQMQHMPEGMGELEMSVAIALEDWQLDAELTDADFAFEPPAGAKKVDSLLEGMGGGESIHPLVGEPAPEFTLATLDGDEFELADALGEKVIMLDFWATWCGPCVKALPEVTAAAESFAGNDVVFFAVNVEEDEETIREFLDGKELRTPILLDAEGEVSGLYQASGIPQTVLIGKDKRVQVVHVGAGPDMEKILKKQITQLLEGEDLAAATLEAADEPARDDFAAEETWTVKGGVSSVEVDRASGAIYALRSGGVAQYDAAGEEQARFELSGGNRTLRLADLNGDRQSEFLTFSTWSSPLSAFSRDGELLWTYPQGQGIDDVFAADLDGDGVDEVIVGFNGGTGLHVIDAAGEELWKNTSLGNVWHVTAGLFEENEPARVISTSAAGDVHVFDAEGNHLRDLDPGLYGNGVQFAPEQQGGAPFVLVTGSSDAGEGVVRLSPEGEIAWQTSLPGGDHVDHLAVSADGRHAAIAVRGGVVHVVDVQSGELIAQATGRGQMVDADMLRDGERLILLLADDRGLTAYVIAEKAAATDSAAVE